MKKAIGIIIAIFVLTLLVSCSDKEEVADEIVRYYNEDWITINSTKEKEMQDIIRNLEKFEEEGRTDEAAHIYKHEIIPTAEKVVERYKSLDPANKKIEKMNDMQIDADEDFIETSKDVLTYYNGGDVSEQDLKEQNEEIKKKRGKVLDYRDELMDEYNLEEVEDGNEDGRFPKIQRAED